MKSFFIALSMYSKIPMPQFPWEEKDMRYAMCFFSLVGAIIGVAEVVWFFICQRYKVGNIAFSFVGAALPLLISGGIHMDGFMDTMDALHSYQGKERKLEILKDSHIGAFSVICLLGYELLYLGAFSEIKTFWQMLLVAITFFLSRTLSGIGVVSFKCARQEGTLYVFADSAHRRVVKLSLYLQLVLAVILLLYVSPVCGIVVAVGMFLVFAYYRYKAYREFGGITGDLAGYFVTLAEAAAVVLVAVTGYFAG